MTKAGKVRAAANPRLWDLILAPEGLHTMFQPVFEIRKGRRTLFSVEALTRGPRGSGAERPDVLFDFVRRKRGEVAVDRLEKKIRDRYPVIRHIYLEADAVAAPERVGQADKGAPALLKSDNRPASPSSPPS